MTKIYTKKGDTGETGLLTGKRLPKNYPTIEALGALDETISILGIVRARLAEKNFKAEIQVIEKIQKVFFYLGSVVAREGKMDKKWPPALTQELEEEIDRMESALPQLKNFILPGADPVSALIHHARSVARATERRVVPVLAKTHAKVTIAYVNRVSDYLFVLARWIARANQAQEILVHPDSLI